MDQTSAWGLVRSLEIRTANHTPIPTDHDNQQVLWISLLNPDLHHTEGRVYPAGVFYIKVDSTPKYHTMLQMLLAAQASYTFARQAGSDPNQAVGVTVIVPDGTHYTENDEYVEVDWVKLVDHG